MCNNLNEPGNEEGKTPKARQDSLIQNATQRIRATYRQTRMDEYMRHVKKGKQGKTQLSERKKSQ